MDKREEIEKYLETKYKDKSDFVVVDDKIYSRTSISWQTLNGINDIHPIVAVFYLSSGSKPFNKGFKIGVVLSHV